jgi:intraflagellar transport protein 140
VFPDTNIYIYDLEIDNFLYYDFGPTHVPVDLAWDTSDPRLLQVEIDALGGVLEDEADGSLQTEAVTLFVTAEYGVNKQDSIPIEGEIHAILGISVPHIYFIGKESGQENLSGVAKIVKRSMRDFIGLEDCDDLIRKAILNFSFYLTAGNMDEAYKAVKKI